MHKNAQKAKGWRPKTQTSKSNMEDETILSPMPLRSIPPLPIDDEVSTEEVPAIHNNYLPWVDYTNIRELDNPKSGLVNDDDVGGEKSQVVIDDEENVEEEADEPIVEERVFDSSCAAVSETTGMSEPSVMPSVDDRSDMNNEPSVVAEADRDVVESTDLDGENVVPSGVEEPSTDDLGEREDPSVKDTLDRTGVN
ncbi:hypothetical protein LIER_27247 [Lithospermum erythrorhizon]|uniref:Uncharacterized protein n=1 Tax=Lithospermum erythrorhizon TaxID=34254 RepID=A0AAV3RDD2_LITER